MSTPIPSTIPVLALDGLLEGDPTALARIARALPEPCTRLGVFHVTGHGIPADDLAAFERAMRALFDLPAAGKRAIRRTEDNAWGYYDRELTKNRRDWKEIFDFGPERGTDDGHAPRGPGLDHSDGRNRWPAGHAELKRALLAHFAACERLARALLRPICLSLGLAPDRLDACFEDHSSFLRLNYYPPCPEPAPADAAPLPARGALGVHPHSDAGALTILHQDGVAGLQVVLGDRFVPVDPVPGALTVNLGDMLRVWSNDRYRSPVHRVLANAERARYSAPFFLNPRYDTICEPLRAPREPGRTRPRFRPVSWAHFREQRSAGDYADRGPEIQVDDYLIEPER